MAEYSAFNHRLMGLVAWRPEEPARKVCEDIFVSPAVSWCYLVASRDGDVLINTGMPHEARRHRERFEQLLGRPLAVRKIVITQSHPDHMGGWQVFKDEGAEIIVHRDYPWLWRERQELSDFFRPREARVLPTVTSASDHESWHKAAVEIPDPTVFSEHHEFEVGGRRFELYATPSGETLDSLVVWLPAERTVFTGNLMGALPGSLPHFYTVRGDRARNMTRFIADMKLLLELAPQRILMGHGEPIEGEDAARAYLTKLRDAVLFIRNATVAGMNEGKDLHTLMREIRLPPDLAHLPGRGRLSWYVRAMWEELTGWFRQQSTTELYEVAQQEVWGDLVSLAGADKLTERARDHFENGRPVHALHLVDLVLHEDPRNRLAREVEIDCLNLLMEQGKGELLDEQGWLETTLARARAALDE